MRKKILIVIGILVFVLAAVLLWPTSGYEISRVHQSLRALETPYQSVSTGYYLDGGSIGITIIDRDSRKLKLALPVSLESGRRSYRRLFIGATHLKNTGAVEVVFSDDTRWMLISVIEQHRTTSDDGDLALIALRGAPRDYARVVPRAVVRCFRIW